ncbi:MAG: CoA transferase [Chloroflexi bacterium]|nr:CoA transferase [Chloroflexota bacterium]
MTLPLDGVTILDMTRLAPGPFCTMMLGDLGAEVIKIEEPGPPTGRRADQASSSEAAGGPIPGSINRYSLSNSLNRNKKSIGLNLKVPEARDIFYKLAERADVIVEEFRPGVTQRLGVDYATIKKINPRLIYCAITGYGQDGPYGNLAGHDINYISIAGALSLFGKRDSPPIIPPNLLADFAGGGLHGVIGILAALLAREKTGRGQFVDISMTDGVVALLSSFLIPYFDESVAMRSEEGFHLGTEPYYNVYRAKDGKYLSLGCLEPWFWANLCRALNREDLIPLQSDQASKIEIFSIMRGIFGTKTRDEWFDYLRQFDIPVAKVNTLDELEIDPHLLHRQMVMEVDHPQKGRVKQVGPAVKLSETPASIRSLTPQLGEHTNNILKELGYSQTRIQALRQAGAIK